MMIFGVCFVLYLIKLTVHHVNGFAVFRNVRLKQGGQASPNNKR